MTRVGRSSRGVVWRGRPFASPASVAICLFLLVPSVAGQEPGAGIPPDPLARYVLSEPAAVLRLPNRLREISGLAVAGDGRLFAHDDERAVIYEVDPRAGELVKAFALGDPVSRADYEGIAVVGDRFYLVTSDGVIYESAEGRDDDRLVFNTYGTGVGRRCEIEGLAHDPIDDVLLMPCKTIRDPALRSFVPVFRWSLAERAIVDPPLLVDLEAVERATEQENFAGLGDRARPAHGRIPADRRPRPGDRLGEPRGAAGAGGAHDSTGTGIGRPKGSRSEPTAVCSLPTRGVGRRARITAYAPIP